MLTVGVTYIGRFLPGPHFITRCAGWHDDAKYLMDAIPDVTKFRTKDGVIYWEGAALAGADAGSFVVLNHQWGMDLKGVYNGNSRMRKADRETFEVLNAIFARDRNHVYYIMGIAKGIDAASIEVLDDGVYSDDDRDHLVYRGYAKDKDHVFFQDRMSGKPRVVRGADRDTFQRLSYDYAKDARRAYYYGWHIKASDAATFQVLGSGYTKDHKRVYYAGEQLGGADSATFEVVPAPASHRWKSLYGRDKKHVFCMKEVLPQANPSTFWLLGTEYATDGDHHFKYTESIAYLPPDLEM